MSNSCPICGKAGLADFRVEHVVCPQCNSDLRPFLLLKGFEVKSGPRSGKPALWFLLFTFSLIVFGALYAMSVSKNKKLTLTNRVLVDSLNLMVSKAGAKDNNDTLINLGGRQVIVRYEVRKGDFPYKIAQFFYNDGSKYRLIEAENGLVRPYTLRVGQILNIKIEQK